MSFERIVFLNAELFKGPYFAAGKILDVATHFKATETLIQYTHVALSVLKMVLLKEKHCAVKNKLSQNTIRVTQAGMKGERHCYSTMYETAYLRGEGGGGYTPHMQLNE